MTETQKGIKIQGLYENNLKIESLHLPLSLLIGITGPSGSGKSTLGEVLFKEGRRMYLESLGLEKKAFCHFSRSTKIHAVTGLPPAIYLEQVPERSHAQHTLAQYTDILTFLRILFSILGTPLCPKCQIPIHQHTPMDLMRYIEKMGSGTRFAIGFPEDFQGLGEIQKEGFARVEIHGQLFLIEDIIGENLSLLERSQHEKINVVVDRLIKGPNIKDRIDDDLRIVLEKGHGIVCLMTLGGNGVSNKSCFSLSMTCPECLTTYPTLEPSLFSPQSAIGQCEKCHGKGCRSCQGTGLSLFSRLVQVAGHNLQDILSMDVHCAKGLFQRLKEEAVDDLKSQRLIEVLIKKTHTLEQAGLGYLGLHRPISTLSRGEYQRLRITRHIGKGLSNCLIIMDEPTVGLHPRDFHILRTLFQQLKESGNTVLVIEHDRSILSSMDWIVELGPGGGSEGGRVCFEGSPTTFLEKRQAPPPTTKEKLIVKKHPQEIALDLWVEFSNISKNNLKDLSIRLPLHALVLVTGVSGSGKSTLVTDEILSRLKKKGYSVHFLDQSPLRGSARSMVVTYIGALDPIRSLFAKTKTARMKGISANMFSIAKPGGRCEACGGKGVTYLDLKYLPPVEEVCPVCGGKRFRPEVLQCLYKGLSISDVLDLTVEEAEGFFSRHRNIRSPLQWASRSGVGYLTLGQWTNTLSGGERLRLKLAQLLEKKARTGAQDSFKTSWLILDEPSAGLSHRDVEDLMKQIGSMVNQGLSAIIVDHHELIRDFADWEIQLGPEGGPGGGFITYEGPPH